MNRVWVVIMCFIQCAGLAIASGQMETAVAFDEANRRYEEGRFQDAIQAYQSLLTNAPTVAVHYNLGNAYFKAGQLGEAIAAYLQARQLSPRDPDVQANLRFARDRVRGPSYSEGWLDQRAHALSMRGWRRLVSAVIWLFFGTLIASELLPRWRRPLRFWVTFTGAAAVIAVSGLVWINRTLSKTRVAVTTERTLVMRLGPFEESESMLDLKDGAELRVLDRKAGWLQITPGEGAVGWVPADGVRLIQSSAD